MNQFNEPKLVVFLYYCFILLSSKKLLGPVDFQIYCIGGPVNEQVFREDWDRILQNTPFEQLQVEQIFPTNVVGYKGLEENHVSRVHGGDPWYDLYIDI